MSVWKVKNKKTWTAKFKYLGKQYKKEGFQTRSKAMAWEVQRREELQEPVQIHLAFSVVANKYLRFCQARMRKNTWRQKAFVYRSFLAFLQNDPVIDLLTKDNFLSFFEFRSGIDGNCAANRDLKDFKALFNWAIKQEISTKNLCVNIDKLPEYTVDRYVPPAEHIQKVLAIADQDDFDLLVVLYHTAGRIGEILGITWTDINFDQRWIKLKTRKRRGGELEVDKLPLTEILFEILRKCYEGRDESVEWVFPGVNGEKLT